MNEKRKKLKLKINSFDIFIILLVLCLLATLVYRIYNAVEESSGKNKTSYEVYFECEDEYNSIEKYLKNGDAVYFGSSGELLGYLTKYDHNSLIEISTDDAAQSKETEANTEADSASESMADGASNITDEAETEYEYDKIDFKGALKLNGNAQKSNVGDYFSLGQDKITVGSRIQVYTDSAQFTILITQIISE